jgi:hypothetical protein
MVSLEKTAANPQTFMRLYGISYGSFQVLLAKVEAYIQAQKQANPLSKRGRKAGLDVAEQLLLTLVYLRQYITFLSLGHQFGISESYAYKRYTCMRNILMHVLEMPDKGQLSFEMLTNKVGIDVSEQPIERPLQHQKQYYSGKKKGIR